MERTLTPTNAVSPGATEEADGGGGGPPHATRREQQVEAELTFTRDAKLLDLLPHSHLRGVRWEYEAVYPDGRRETILSVPEYDFNWQTDYVFDEPLALPRGSRIHASAWYDNSVANRSNPDPTAEVRWGEQTDEEMMYTALSFLIDDEAAAETTQQD